MHDAEVISFHKINKRKAHERYLKVWSQSAWKEMANEGNWPSGSDNPKGTEVHSEIERTYKWMW